MTEIQVNFMGGFKVFRYSLAGKAPPVVAWRCVNESDEEFYGISSAPKIAISNMRTNVWGKIKHAELVWL